MFLDRIDIDQHGPLTHVELGPFSEQLNAVLGPEGSGKTAIARFVRDSLIQREYPLGMMNSSSGRVVWASRDGKIHCRREQDGTNSGRKTVEFESYGGASLRFDWLHDSWLRSAADSTDADRALAAVQIPESIVDGIVIDTAVTSVVRVLQACQRSGLTDRSLYERLPLNRSPVSATSPEDIDRSDRSTLRDELARIEAELATYGSARHTTHAYDRSVAQRRQRLQSRLAELRAWSKDSYVEVPGTAPRPDQETIWHLRARESELQRWIAHLEADRNRMEKVSETKTPRVSLHDSLRSKLHTLDQQIIRWRRLLAEFQGLRQVVLNEFPRAYRPYAHSQGLPAGYAETLANRKEEYDLRCEAILQQLRWLIDDCDRSTDTKAWYTSSATYHARHSLVDGLRAIRDDFAAHRIGHGDFRYNFTGDIDHLHRAQRWAVNAVEQLLGYRESLVRGHQFADSIRYPSWLDRSYLSKPWSSWYVEHVQSEYEASTRELHTVQSQLNAYLSEGRSARDYPGYFPSERTRHSLQAEMDSIATELRSLDQVSDNRYEWLIQRRDELITQLGTQPVQTFSQSPLADDASQWLVRLSGGQLRRLDWDASATHVMVDRTHESSCPPSVRACAALALRLAAADLLARHSRPVPLIIETHRDLVSQATPHLSSAATYEPGRNLALVTALNDFTGLGRQVILLTSDTALADQVDRRGGHVTQLQTKQIAHAHRPIWQPHFASDHYHGPYRYPASVAGMDYQGSTLPHTDPLLYASPLIGTYFDAQHFGSQYGGPTSDVTADGAPAHAVSVAPTSGHPAASDWLDGYCYTNTYTTHNDKVTPVATVGEEAAGEPSNEAVLDRKPTSPFFLSVDSPIDQAPSIDAVAASRLRALNVSHISHLMQQDPNRLADALGLRSATAATIRRWQAECRLMCNVPQLRGFDARILVGCGVADPRQLSSIDPADLLDRVEAFLATERGQKILLSGTSYELSRITSWIATANASPEDVVAGSINDQRTVDGKVLRYDYEFVDDHGQVVRARSRRGRQRSGYDNRSSRSSTRTRKTSRRNRARTLSARSRTHDHYSHDEVAARGYERTGSETERHEQTTELRFYLHRESPVVDAPSIGERMSEKLAAIGVVTVDDLLNTDAAEIAEGLEHRRIDADVVAAWQSQAILVCRIPMLRGHDAQLLVAAEVTSPEELTQYDAESLLELIDPIVRSNEGKRILRGSKAPDLAEVTDWINYAALNRELKAA